MFLYPLVFMMEGQDLAKLIGKKHRYAILLRMYPNKRYYVTELASALDIERRNLGRYLEELRKANLVVFTEEQGSDGGKPYRYYSLTDSAKAIILTYINVTTETYELKLEKWHIDKLVQLLKDDRLSDELRESTVHRFFSFCQEDPIYMTENENVRKIFEDTVENPTQLDEKIGGRLRASVSTSFARLLADEDRGKWALERLYPSIAACLEDKLKDDKIRTWALRLIGDVCRIGSDQRIQKDAKEKIFKIYFSSETKPDGKLSENAKQELLELTSKHLFEKTQQKTQSDDKLERNKAETLMKEMIKSFGYRK